VIVTGGSTERIAWGDWGEAVMLDLAYKHPRWQANEDSPTFELTQPAPEDLVHVVTSLPLICVLQFDDLRP